MFSESVTRCWSSHSHRPVWDNQSFKVLESFNDPKKKTPENLIKWCDSAYLKTAPLRGGILHTRGVEFALHRFAPICTDLHMRAKFFVTQKTKQIPSWSRENLHGAVSKKICCVWKLVRKNVYHNSNTFVSLSNKSFVIHFFISIAFCLLNQNRHHTLLLQYLIHYQINEYTSFERKINMRESIQGMGKFSKIRKIIRG